MTHNRSTLHRVMVVAALSAYAGAAQAGGTFELLVFTKTVGFHHNSIDHGVALVEQLGLDNGFGVTVTEDASIFATASLEPYAVILWLSTTGDVLNTQQQTAFENYMQSGGGYVGVHAASDCEYGWMWYGGLLGNNAWFQSHPAIQTATLEVLDPDHISTAHLPASFSFTDEWYNFQNDPSPLVNVLLTIDESSYNGGNMGASHPMSWYHEYDGGRVWYTALGHRNQTYANPDFINHLLGGILWAAGADGCEADLDASGAVNAVDLAQLLGDWGNSTGASDLNLDGTVDASDLATMLGAWGSCP